MSSTRWPRCTVFIKRDHQPLPGEVVEDDFLIRADKNPNTAGARAVFGAQADQPVQFAPDTDLVLVWGEGCNFADLPRGVPIVSLQSYIAPENGFADVFIPISHQPERSGTYTNGDGATRAFTRCVPKAPAVQDAADVFHALAALPVTAS